LELFRLVEKYGESWKTIAGVMGERTDIQCRYQFVKAHLSREQPWSPLEDELLMKKVNGIIMFRVALIWLFDHKDIKSENSDVSWVMVSKFMARGKLTKIPRTALECRNRYHTHSLLRFHF